MTAPFEYVSLTISVLWGFAIGRKVPAPLTRVAAALKILRGLYTQCLGRQSRDGVIPVRRGPQRRRVRDGPERAGEPRRVALVRASS